MSCNSILDEEDEIMYHIDQINPTLKDDYLKNKQIFGFNSENLYSEIEDLITHLESYEKTLAQLKIVFTDYYNNSQKKIKIIKVLEEKVNDLLHKNNIYRIVNDDLRNSLDSEEQKNKILTEHLHEKEIEVSNFEKLNQLKSQSLSNSNSALLKNSNNKSEETISGHPRNKSQQMPNFHQSSKKQKKNEPIPLIRRLTFDLDALKFQNKNFEEKIKRLSEDYENLHHEYDRTVSIKEKIVNAYNKKEKDLEFMQKEILNLQNQLDHYKKICIYQNNMLTEGITHQKCDRCNTKENRHCKSLTSLNEEEKDMVKKKSNRLLFDKIEEIGSINLRDELNSRLFTVLNSENFDKFNRISQLSMDKAISNSFLKRNSQLNLEENSDSQFNLRKHTNLNFPLDENFDYEPLKKHLSCLSINENEVSKEEEEEEKEKKSNLSDLSMRIPNPNSERSFEELHAEI